MKPHVTRFDAPFWVALLAGAIFVGSVGFISLAAAAEGAQSNDSAVLTTDDS